MYVYLYSCIYVCIIIYMCMYLCICYICLIPTGSEEGEELGVGIIPVAIHSSCQYMKMFDHNCINMTIVG